MYHLAVDLEASATVGLVRTLRALPQVISARRRETVFPRARPTPTTCTEPRILVKIETEKHVFIPYLIGLSIADGRCVFPPGWKIRVIEVGNLWIQMLHTLAFSVFTLWALCFMCPASRTALLIEDFSNDVMFHFRDRLEIFLFGKTVQTPLPGAPAPPTSSRILRGGE